DAWVWEHQALVRARPVAGDVRIGAAFNEIRRNHPLPAARPHGTEDRNRRHAHAHRGQCR
ncbi:MAG: hypothetical protein HC809_06645, partial [Gammaproteobacteria bacterium]|nr:hypothetical protein [Gammaproteobacteria bacterium]